MDHFGLRPWEIARLTPVQIAELYFHLRDEDGAMKIPETKTAPERPLTAQEHVARFRSQARALELPADKIEKKVAEILAHYRAKAEG